VVQDQAWGPVDWAALAGSSIEQLAPLSDAEPIKPDGQDAHSRGLTAPVRNAKQNFSTSPKGLEIAFCFSKSQSFGLCFPTSAGGLRVHSPC
jgi:hypothetical protein